jgi:hypothetical protein
VDVYVVTVPSDQIHFATVALDERSKNVAEHSLDLVSYVVVHPGSRLLTRSHKCNEFGGQGHALLMGNAPVPSIVAL